MLTQELLKKELHYDPDTGLFFRLKTGKQAGSINKYHKYHLISVHGKQYRLHRLAWFYVYGEWPIAEIDHINGNKSDNSILNLRDVDRSSNMLNMRKPQKNNSCGFLGVHKTSCGRYRASIGINGKRISIGNFSTPEEASNAYNNYKACTLVETRL